MAVGSFSAGLSGLSANATYLSVIGNNLANINTVGFKASTVNFVDLVSQTVASTSANPAQVGLGVMTGSISPVFSQGAAQTSREATNAAIQGNGFFVVMTPTGPAYTRDGSFSLNADGELVTADDMPVQGWTAVDPATGKISTQGVPTNIVVPPGVLRAPVATTSFQTLCNLDANAAVGESYTTGVQIFDALGTSHVLGITYTNTAPGAWSYRVDVDGGDVTGGTEGTPFQLAQGTVAFDPTGKMLSVNGAAPADVTIASPAWANGAAPTPITWDLVDANNQGALTGYDAASATSSKTQNGASAGMVDNISILPDGTIQATFGAGQTVAVAKLALVTFNNPKGSNRFSGSEAAGLPNLGEANTGGRGTVIGSALEQSNVDIAQEFTQMILAQRGYQANAKTITVSDELLLETIQIKR